MPSKTEPPVFEPPPPAEFSWTCFYLGIHAGGGLDHFGFPFDIFVPAPGGFVKGTDGITAAGPIGGLQAGFNYELPFFHIVAGVEIGNSASGIGGQTTVNGTLLSGVPATATFGSKFEDFGTARLRLGYAWGRFLPYLTGGFTYGTIETSYSVATPGFFNAGSCTATRTGVITRILDPVQHTHGVSYRPRWFELQIRLAGAASDAYCRKILERFPVSRARLDSDKIRRRNRSMRFIAQIERGDTKYLERYPH